MPADLFAQRLQETNPLMLLTGGGHLPPQIILAYCLQLPMCNSEQDAHCVNSPPSWQNTAIISEVTPHRLLRLLTCKAK